MIKSWKGQALACITSALLLNTTQSVALAAEAGGAAAQQSPIPSIIMLSVFAVVFYFLLIRPQQKQQQQAQQLISNLDKGDEVLLSGGITGKITEMDDTFIQLEIAPEVTIKATKTSVVKSYPKGSL